MCVGKSSCYSNVNVKVLAQTEINLILPNTHLLKKAYTNNTIEYRELVKYDNIKY